MSFGSLTGNISAGEVTLEGGTRRTLGLSAESARFLFFSSSLLYPALGAKGSSCSLLKVGQPVSEVASSVPLPLVTVADGGAVLWRPPPPVLLSWSARRKLCRAI